MKGMTDLWKAKVTIYHSIQNNDGTSRSFKRFVLDKCLIQSGTVEKAVGTVRNVVNAKTVITKNIKRYIKPFEYANLSDEKSDSFYTVQVGDFVVLAEVNDAVTNALEFSKLQQKYKDNGFKVMNISENINEMAVDNISITNV